MVDALLEEAVKVARAKQGNQVKVAGEDLDIVRDLTEVPEPI
jgi:hypothetical protein